MDVVEPQYSWGRMQEIKNRPRSVSQVKSYLHELGGCSYAYFLSRVAFVWERPAAWLPQGLAVHEAAEYWEKSLRRKGPNEVLERYKTSYKTHTARLEESTPNHDLWFPSGPYKGWKDITRRAKLGYDQVNGYIDYYDTGIGRSENIWHMPNGELAVEIYFEIMLDRVPVIGYIDQIVQHFLKLELTIRDIKSGNKPGDTLQLKVYDLAIEDMFDVSIGRGDYWMGRKLKPTKPYDLTKMSREQVTDLFGRMDQGVKAEQFEPNPSRERCMFCPVASACQYRED